MLIAGTSEEVNDVSETEDAIMCVAIANQAYEEIISGKRWKFLRTWEQLISTTGLNQLVTPSGTVWVSPSDLYYDGVRLTYYTPEDFVSKTISRNETDTNITVIDGVKVINNATPTFFTSFDDTTLTFDAMPDTTNGLVPSKTKALLYKTSANRLSEATEYFELPSQMYPVLEAMAKWKALVEVFKDTSAADRIAPKAQKLLNAACRNHKLIDKAFDFNTNVTSRPTRLFKPTVRRTT